MNIYKKRIETLFNETVKGIDIVWPEKKETWLAQRYALWCASGLLSSKDNDKRQRAIKMIEECGELPDCSFSPMLSTKLLHSYSEILPDSIKNKLLDYLKNGAFEKMLLPDFDYVGVNDNFPSMASYVALVGGEYFSDERAISIGKERLRDFHSALARRDMASEYTSPCYIPFSIIAMASIANDVNDNEVRQMAIECEQQLWADIAYHLHPKYNLMAGPYSRSYAAETLALFSNAAALTYIAFGLGDPSNLASKCFENSNEIEATSCWAASVGGYHCTDELIDIAVNKEYPFNVTMTAEIAPSRYHDEDDIKSLAWLDYKETALSKDRLDEYPAGVTVNTTHIEERFAIGTALRPFHSGIQTDSLHVLYEKDNIINTIFTKYSINDKVIGKDNYNEWLKSPAMPCLDDEGRKFGIQANSTSLMVYKPTYYCHDSLKEARLQVIFSTKGRPLEKIMVGNNYIDTNTTFEKIEPFFVSDGSIYAAFIPLEVSDLGRMYAMSFSYINDFAVFSLCNYNGAKASFRKNEMLLASNGFIVTVKDKDEFSSFEEFADEYRKYELKDVTFACGHTRGSHERKIYFKNSDAELSFVYSPMTEGIRYAVANGKTIV